jgi:calpain-3
MFVKDKSRIDKRVKWLRPHEFAENPVLFLGGVEPGDVCQGDLGDCWFLSALSCVGNE